MDTATVWMCSLSDCGQESLLDRLPALLDAASAARGARWSGALAAVKVAAGELGNTTYLRPAFVRAVVDDLRRRGATPVVVETTTLYPGRRDTAAGYLDVAARNGFCAETLGAPLIIADGLRGGWEASFELGLPEMERVEVAGALATPPGATAAFGRHLAVADIGVLAAVDPVAIDVAARDLVLASAPAGSGGAAGPETTPWDGELCADHLRRAAELGVGAMMYRLVRLKG